MDRQERAAIRLTIEEKKAQIASKDASIKEMEERKKAQQAEKKAIEAEISKLNKQLNADTKEFEKALRKKYSAFLKELYESGKVPDYFKTIVVEDEHGDYAEILNLQKYNGRPVENIRGCILNTSMIRFTGKDRYLKSLVKAGFKKTGVTILKETPGNRMSIRDRFLLAFIYFRDVFPTEQGAVGAAIALLKKMPKNEGIITALFDADQDLKEAKKTAEKEGD